MSEVRLSGPLFDGRAVHAVDAMARAIEDRVGQFAYEQVQDRLGVVLRHPTGYYESRVRTDRQSRGVVVDDDMVVYGPWLEGVGSRNRTTRFKGYFTFRQVGALVDREAARVAQPVVDRYVREMN